MNKSEIYDIYNKYIKINETTEYSNKYVPLPLEYNNKNWKWEGKDFPRVISLLEFKRYMEKYNFHFNNVLSFNGSNDPEYEYIKYNNITNYNYESDIINYDLHTLNLKKKDFDFVMINQTIEHLYDPILCLENIYDHLNKDGIFYANVPTNNIPHSTPEHYYTGITPSGLGVMTKLAGFNILEIGQWGNREYLNILFSTGWSDYKYSNTPGINELDCPLITWVLAKK
jgi:SAM-dependent methyltransferase